MEQWEIHWEDYYKILQVDLSAEPDIIKAAFRKLSQKYHPDTNKGDNKTEEIFKKINRAYETLSNPEKRDRYHSEWLRRSSKDTFSRKTHTAPKPKPVVEPTHINFTDISPREVQKASFVIRNNGGPYTKIWFSNPDSWVRVVSWTSLDPSQNDELPLRVEIEVEGDEWGESYSEYIRVRLDEEEIHIKVELQTKSKPAIKFTESIATTSTINLKRFRWQSMPAFIVISGLIGIALILIAIIVGPKSSAPPQRTSGVRFTVTAYRDVNVNVRTGPSESADLLGVMSVHKGKTLSVLESEGDWYKIDVKVRGKDKVGWIQRSLVVLAEFTKPEIPSFNISGNWEGKWKYEGTSALLTDPLGPKVGTEMNFKLSIEQSGPDFKSTITYFGREGSSSATGKITGNEISFEYAYKDGAVMKYSGRVNNGGSEAQGRWTQQDKFGSWTMVKKAETPSPEAPSQEPTPESTPSSTPIPKTTPEPPPAPEPTSFKVEISSSPPEATVLINKKVRGKTPFSIVLEKGSYGIAIQKKGYRTNWDMIKVDKDGKKEFYFTLEKE